MPQQDSSMSVHFTRGGSKRKRSGEGRGGDKGGVQSVVIKNAGAKKKGKKEGGAKIQRIKDSPGLNSFSVTPAVCGPQGGKKIADQVQHKGTRDFCGRKGSFQVLSRSKAWSKAG